MSDQIYVSVPLNVSALADSLVGSMDQDKALAFVLALDLSIADAGFTEDLVLKLLSSLAGDLEKDEWDSLCRKVRAFK